MDGWIERKKRWIDGNVDRKIRKKEKTDRQIDGWMDR